MNLRKNGRQDVHSLSIRSHVMPLVSCSTIYLVNNVSRKTQEIYKMTDFIRQENLQKE